MTRRASIANRCLMRTSMVTTYQHHGIGHLSKQYLERLDAWAIIQLILSILLQPGFRFGTRKPLPWVGFQLCDNSLSFKSMRWLAQWLTVLFCGIVLHGD